jgi:hypothetical protein
MKTTTVTAALAAMLLGGWGRAGNEDTNQAPPALRLELDLADGSYIIGIPKIESAPVQTAYAKMEIPLRQILSVKMGDDHETATLELRNGDRIKGFLTLGPLKLMTLFGAVSVGIEHVRSLRVYAGDGLPPRLRDALTLHYSFDEDERGVVKDDSGNVAPARVTGAKWTTDGKRGGAFDFNGRDAYITTPAVDTAGNATWSVWIRPRSFPTQNDTYGQFLGVRGRAWIWNSDNTSLSFSCQSSYGGSRLGLLFVVMGKTDSVMGHTLHIFPERPELDRWYHVAGVWDSRGMHLYLNGALLSESADAIPIPVACPLIIGANDNGPQRYFDGLIDEVMIFKKALSAGDIKTLYEATR